LIYYQGVVGQTFATLPVVPYTGGVGTSTEQTAFWAQMGTFDEEWHRIIRPAEFLVADQADWALQSAEDEEDLCPKNDSGAMFIIGVVHAVCAKYANEPQLDWKILAATSTLT